MQNEEHYLNDVKQGSWLHDLILVLNDLGGEALYKDIYPLAKKRRLSREASWTKDAEASIRRTIEDNAPSSNNYKKKKHKKEVFYSVHGHGKGRWALFPRYRKLKQENFELQQYEQGIEGIRKEYIYLKYSRDPLIAEKRKQKDNFTCQACGFYKKISENHFIIDVHHLNPISQSNGEVFTAIDDLICLCPNCHRIAHSGKMKPLTVEEILKFL